MLKCFLVENDDPQFQEKIRKPGAMWYCPWLFDPARTDNKRPLGQAGFLSEHYWRDHGATRPPITVRCPDGREWLVDQVSSNGTGWAVTGEAPEITCAPSIVMPNYHGFLQGGVFTPDLEGRTY